MIFVFGAIGWLIAVIEAMVAGPIVALGVTHPEGHDAFGKGEAAIMILINVFLRPAMMIIGYIAAIALSYVGIWVLNSGYNQATAYIQQASSDPGAMNTAQEVLQNISGSVSYSDWTAIYAFFFSILTYTTLYLIIIQRAFTLITYLPDKVLRWIGGGPESIGQEATQWGEEVKRGQEKGAESIQKEGSGQIQKQLGGYGAKAVGGVRDTVGKLGGGGGVEGFGGNSTPDGGGGGGKDGGGKDGGKGDDAKKAATTVLSNK
jgi:defect-in-organelle-trafficking protein DotA